MGKFLKLRCLSHKHLLIMALFLEDIPQLHQFQLFASLKNENVCLHSYLALSMIVVQRMVVVQERSHRKLFESLGKAFSWSLLYGIYTRNFPHIALNLDEKSAESGSSLDQQQGGLGTKMPVLFDNALTKSPKASKNGENTTSTEIKVIFIKLCN